MAKDFDPQAKAKFRCAFAQLPWVQREIFRAHRVEGLTYGEIAWLMRVSEAFVEKQMAKAIFKLMKQMEGDTLRWWEKWF